MRFCGERDVRTTVPGWRVSVHNETIVRIIQHPPQHPSQTPSDRQALEHDEHMNCIIFNTFLRGLPPKKINNVDPIITYVHEVNLILMSSILKRRGGGLLYSYGFNRLCLTKEAGRRPVWGIRWTMF